MNQPTTVHIEGPAPSITQTMKPSGNNIKASPILYLCGPIAGQDDHGASHWREWVKQRWQGGWIDPMTRDYRKVEMNKGVARELVNGDLADIKCSDALLVYFDKPSVGTSMEIFYAAAVLAKPVFLINATGRPSSELSPWLMHHVIGISESLSSATLTDIWEALK